MTVERTLCKSAPILVAALALCFALPLKAPATRLPADMSQNVTDVFPDGKVRLDGSIHTTGGELFLPVIPQGAARKRGKAVIESAYPNAEHPDLLVYGNGWCYLRVLKRGIARTVVQPEHLPEKLQKHLISCRLPSDLIVPEHFVLPQSLKPIAGELALQFLQDAAIADPEFGKPRKHGGPAKNQHDGYVFLTSLSTGSITMLDERKMTKVADFPTEGTPSSMAFANGKLYITDQAKNRILILDPIQKQFLGQIDLPLRSAPKGIAILPNGLLMYVAESGANDVVVIEVSNYKVLMRTKMPSGPGRMAVTPNGNFLIVLNVPSGQVSIVSTLNQKLNATIATGAMPTSVVIGADSQTAYVTNRQANTVSVIDIAKKQVVSTIKTGNAPTGVALSRDDARLFVANARDNNIAVFDTRSHEQVGEVKLPLDIDFPSTVSLMPDGNRLLVASEATDTVGILNLETLQFQEQTNIGHSSHDIVWIPKAP